MNERIRELAEQAGAVFEKTNGLNDCPQDSLVGDEIEKFAELIVRECITNIAHDTANWQGDEGTMAYYQGVQDAVKSIRKHFGVEE